MTSPATLHAILARLEAASGPLDPETACRIHALGQGEFISYLGEGCGDGGATEHEYEVAATPTKYAIIYVLARDLPDRSIDAAVALARHIGVDAIEISMGPSENVGRIVWWPEGLSGSWEIATEGVALSAPLALCAALIRALIARSEATPDPAPAPGPSPIGPTPRRPRGGLSKNGE